MRTTTLFCTASLVLYLSALTFADPADDPITEAIRTVRQIQIEGEGSSSATDAWKKLAGSDPSELPKILAGMKDANPIVSNWLASAADVVFQAVKKGSGTFCRNGPEGASHKRCLTPFLLDQLEQFVLDPTQSGQGRTLVYDSLCRVDPNYRERLLPKLLGDHWSDLCQKATQYAIEQAETLEKKMLEKEALDETDVNKNDADKAEVIAAYQKILDAARDLDQIRDLARRLEKLGQKVDLAAQLGFIIDWHVVGPFDGTGPESFHHVFPPEEPENLQKRFTFEATYEGKPALDDETEKPRTLRWIKHHTDKASGNVDLNRLLCEEKEVIAYVVTDFISDRDQDVELRVSSRSATKIWVNGHLASIFEFYHTGDQFDLYQTKAKFRQGKNTIVMKVRQDEQTQTWAKNWAYRLRVCNPLGYGIVSEDRE